MTGIAVFLAIDTANSRSRLMGFSGVVLMMTLGFIFSKHPTKVKAIKIKKNYNAMFQILYKATTINILKTFQIKKFSRSTGERLFGA